MSRLNPTRVYLGLLAIALVSAVVLYVTRPSPSLTIKINGVPAAGQVFKLLDTTEVVADETGTVYPENPNGCEITVLVKHPGGTYFVRLPESGNRSVDFYSDRIVTEETTWVYGVFPSHSQHAQYDFTGDEAERIEKGEHPDSVLQSRHVDHED